MIHQSKDQRILFQQLTFKAKKRRLTTMSQLQAKTIQNQVVVQRTSGANF